MDIYNIIKQMSIIDAMSKAKDIGTKETGDPKIRTVTILCGFVPI
jgi:hypothetical protein